MQAASFPPIVEKVISGTIDNPVWLPQTIPEDHSVDGDVVVVDGDVQLLLLS